MVVKLLWTLFILCLAGGGLIIYVNKVDRGNRVARERRDEEIAFRKLEQNVYELTGNDKVCWTTKGTNISLHLFENCTSFHQMPIEMGNVKDGFDYFSYRRNVFPKICNECSMKAAKH